jgi:hypothetical protein
MDFDVRPRADENAHPLADAYRSAETLVGSVTHEGLGGFMNDLPGALDRVVAEQQLRPEFELDDHPVASVAPNVVSSDEFHQTAASFSAVRRGAGNLSVQPDGAAPPAAQSDFANGSMHEIAETLRTPTGRAEVDALVNAPHKTTIEPMAAGQTVPMTLPPKDSMSDWQARMNKDGTARDGSDAHISLNPNQSYFGLPADVALAHEMAHAVSETNGMMDTQKADASDGVSRDRGVPRFEHQAIGIGKYANVPFSENSYRAERNALAPSAGDNVCSPDELPPRAADRDLPQ